MTIHSVNDSTEIPILIPVYKPSRELPKLIQRLVELGASSIIVVDDGNGSEFATFFQDLASCANVATVRHAINLGKGAALKTGLNYALCTFPECGGVVTADADGQHHPEDVLSVAQRLQADPAALIMGVRSFDKGVPLRSRVGNLLTRVLMHWLVGKRIADTQTGLRGIPRALIPHLLRISSSGYEFELDMLLAAKHQNTPVIEQPIRTIYMNGNKSSHFHPIFDSMRIYLLLLRFSILSVMSALVDNVVFAIVFSRTSNIGQSQLIARSISMVFNYLGARHAVFHSVQKHTSVFPKYLFLVVCNGFISYAFILFLHSYLNFQAVYAKLLAESLLFIANFTIQRDFVFTRRKMLSSHPAP